MKYLILSFNIVSFHLVSLYFNLTLTIYHNNNIRYVFYQLREIYNYIIIFLYNYINNKNYNLYYKKYIINIKFNNSNVNVK